MQQGSSKMTKSQGREDVEETEEERHLKKLVKMQTNTDLSVAELVFSFHFLKAISYL